MWTARFSMHEKWHANLFVSPSNRSLAWRECFGTSLDNGVLKARNSKNNHLAEAALELGREQLAKRVADSTWLVAEYAAANVWNQQHRCWSKRGSNESGTPFALELAAIGSPMFCSVHRRISHSVV